MLFVDIMEGCELEFLEHYLRIGKFVNECTLATKYKPLNDLHKREVSALTRDNDRKVYKTNGAHDT